uniref:Uncharacterized protein n=1 Tax=Spongospora subterranea TaxID=70186 RepID=A0A0H5QIJ3_9EUKA|eukprot:CRZ01803.1 hypothetical protein [Spongospora subterranea]
MVEIGESSTIEVHQSMDMMIDRAIAERLTNEFNNRLREIMYRHEDVWKTKLGNDPSAKVSAMKIHFKADCPHYRARARRYSPVHQNFMHMHTADLEQNGFIYRNPHARSAGIAAVRKAAIFE